MHMQGRSRQGRSRLATFVVALALVLQSGLAFAAPPVQRDIFGNVICAAGSASRDAGGKETGHVPDCCLFSCNMASAAGMPPQIVLPAFTTVGEPIVQPTPDIICRHDRRTPANPRAPPHAA